MHAVGAVVAVAEESGEFLVYEGAGTVIARVQGLMQGLRRGFALVDAGYASESGLCECDVVFYHVRYRFYVLVRIATHPERCGDIAELRDAVARFDARYAAPDDGPTAGMLIYRGGLGTVCRVVPPSAAPFSSSYLRVMPTEQEVACALDDMRRCG